jgi:hypothetical protein
LVAFVLMSPNQPVGKISKFPPELIGERRNGQKSNQRR